MSTLKRNNNFTPKQIRGIELTVKSVSKKFPFIEGWKFAPDFEKYDAHLYIDLIIDYEDFAKFYNSEIHPKYKNKTFDILPKVSIPFSFLSTNPFAHWDSQEWKDFFEDSYSKNQKIKNMIFETYESLPDEFCIFYPIKKYYPYEGVTEIKCHLSVNDYIDVRGN